MGSLRAQEGYLSIDHRYSPGLPQGFGFIPGKPLPATAPSGAHVEGPTYTCSHCGTVVWMNPQRTRPHEYCARCDHYVCPSLACTRECRPLKLIVDRLSGLAR